MNEKVMNVFNKNNEQLDKELARRGIPLTTGHRPHRENKICSRERAIAEIIYKDAFDCGRSESNATCPEGCKGKPKTSDYLFCDREADISYKLALTEEQIAVFEWLLREDILNSQIFTFDPFSRFVDVGRLK